MKCPGDSRWLAASATLVAATLAALLSASPDEARGLREPAWSADGSRVAFAADRGDGFDLYVTAINGSASERLTDDGGR